MTSVWNLRGTAKTDIMLGSWSTTKLPRTALPLSKSKGRGYKLGTQWTWRLVTFRCQASLYRVLIAYDYGKEQFLAILGLDIEKDTKVIASIEHHGSHPGWHVHFATEDANTIPSGIIRGPWVRRKACSIGKPYTSDERQFQAQVFSNVCMAYGLQNASEAGRLI